MNVNENSEEGKISYYIANDSSIMIDWKKYTNQKSPIIIKKIRAN